MKRRREFPHASWYRDRHGSRRWRYRFKGFSAELGRDYGSDEFIQRYEAAVQQQNMGAGRSRTLPGTLNAVVVSWYRSPAFLDLEDSTRTVYRNLIDRLRERHGHKRIAQLEKRHILQLIAEKANTPTAANRRLSLLRLLLDHAMDMGLRRDNPARAVKGYRVAAKGFHTWDEGEIKRFLTFHPLGSLPHTVMSLMLYTGAARGDVVSLGWQNIKGGRIVYRRRKARRSGSVRIDIPIHSELGKVLSDLSKDSLTFLQTKQGRPRSPNGLGNDMRKWCDQAGLSHCTSHGLRKAMARRLAEAGATPHEIQAVTGHRTLKEVERYTRAAARADLADSAFDALDARLNSEQTLTNHPARFAKKRY